MSAGAANLVLAIVMGGFVALILFSLIDYLRDRYMDDPSKGNNRIRRELDRHRGNDD
jgi:hypothetical protein